VVAEYDPATPANDSTGIQARRLVMRVLESSASGAESLSGPKVSFCSKDFLGLLASKPVVEAAKTTLDTYSLGSCGPRGFYGTTRKHLELEDELAHFLEAPESITYSDETTTTASVIPAFAKRGDVLLVDAGVSHAVQIGCKLSRSKLLLFKHNDAADLERYLAAQQRADAKDSGRLAANQRRFIVVEGLYTNYGDVCPLPAFVRLAQKYKWRVILDDSQGFGVLGRTGRGTLEHHGLRHDDVDVHVGSLSGTLSSVGGFCVGSREVVDHQRLAGAGYCFSASAPPFLCATAAAALRTMRKHPEMLAALHTKAQRLHQALESKLSRCARVVSDPVAPTKHIELLLPSVRPAATPRGPSPALYESTGLLSTTPLPPAAPRDLVVSRAAEDFLLADVVKRVVKAGFLITRTHYTPSEALAPQAALKVTVTAAHTDAEIDGVVAALAAAIPAAVEACTRLAAIACTVPSLTEAAQKRAAADEEDGAVSSKGAKASKGRKH
jgi:serine palmitoyltransferase